nr:alpha/beta hydrolase [Streptomyces sp. JUS-F4]
MEKFGLSSHQRHRGFASLAGLVHHVDGLIAHASGTEPEWAAPVRARWSAALGAQRSSPAVPGPAVVVGHSLGGAVALACDSPRIVGRVALSGAGITRLRVPAPLLAATVPWLLRPSVARSTALLRRMAAPGQGELPGHLSSWMCLVARHCRTSLAPPPLPSRLLEQRRTVPTLVVAGRFDPFLPPRALGPAARRRLGAEFQVIEGAGHLLLDEAPVEGPEAATTGHWKLLSPAHRCPINVSGDPHNDDVTCAASSPPISQNVIHATKDWVKGVVQMPNFAGGTTVPAECRAPLGSRPERSPS